VALRRIETSRRARRAGLLQVVVRRVQLCQARPRQLPRFDLEAPPSSGCVAACGRAQQPTTNLNQSSLNSRALRVPPLLHHLRRSAAAAVSRSTTLSAPVDVSMASATSHRSSTWIGRARRDQFRLRMAPIGPVAAELPGHLADTERAAKKAKIRLCNCARGHSSPRGKALRSSST